MRLISEVRLSRDDDSAASPDFYAQGIRDHAERNKHVIVVMEFNLGVSGEQPVRKRPGLALYLSEETYKEHLDEWDAYSCYSVDRGFRNLYDFVTFWHDFLEPNGKGLIITSENIDMSTPDGRTMAQMRVMMAENELNKIKARNKNSATLFRSQGLWHGGQVPFGYMPKRQGKHYILVPHPEHAQIVRDIAVDIIGGKAISEVARELTERKVPTGWAVKDRKNGTKVAYTRWTPGPLARMLRSPVLTGHVPWHYRKDKNGRETFDLVRDGDGEYLRRDPILDDATWAELQKALGRPGQAKRNGQRSDASLLLNVVYCGKCDAKLYFNKFTRTQKTGKQDHYAYYMCSAECGARSINANDLETRISAAVAAITNRVQERTVTKGKNYDMELALNEQAQYSLLAEQDELDEDEFKSRMSHLWAERKRFLTMEMDVEPPKEDIVLRQETYGQLWQRLDAKGRRAFLLGTGLRLYWWRDDSGQLHLSRIEQSERPRYVGIPLTVPDGEPTGRPA